MSLNPYLFGFVVFLGCLIGGIAATPSEETAPAIVFAVFAGANAGLTVGVGRSLRAVLSGGRIRWF